MGKQQSLYRTIVDCALWVSMLFVISPILGDAWNREGLLRAAVGLLIGAAIGAIAGLVTRQFRKKEKEIIEQMHAEVQSEGAPSD